MDVLRLTLCLVLRELYLIQQSLSAGLSLLVFFTKSYGVSGQHLVLLTHLSVKLIGSVLGWEALLEDPINTEVYC